MNKKQEDIQFRYDHYRPGNPKYSFEETVARLALCAQDLKQIKIYDGQKVGLVNVLKARAITICTIHADDKLVATGYAFCSPLDQFSRKKGRDIAQGRALSLIRETV